MIAGKVVVVLGYATWARVCAVDALQAPGIVTEIDPIARCRRQWRFEVTTMEEAVKEEHCDDYR